jgi:integrase
MMVYIKIYIFTKTLLLFVYGFVNGIIRGKRHFMSTKKRIRCSWRGDAGKFQVCYGWDPGRWILTPYTKREDREAAVLWAKENEIFYRHTPSGCPTFEEAARGFFDIGGPYYQKKESRKKHYLDDFYRKKRGHLNNYLMPYFRNIRINEISTYMCEEFTLTLDKLSSDTKNKIIESLKEILKPWVSKGSISSNPVSDVERYGTDTKVRQSFTVEELDQLYPRDLARALDLWGDALRLAWGLILRDTGCRPSEALAWTWADYSEAWGGFPITKRVRSGHTLEGTKGGKFRAAILSDMGNHVIRLLRETAAADEGDRIFLFTVDTGNSYVRAAMARAGVPELVEGSLPRTQYCLRHTAVTQTITIDRAFAREVFGHSTVKVQDGYDHPDTEELFRRVSKAPDILRERLGEGTALNNSTEESPVPTR